MNSINNIGTEKEICKPNSNSSLICCAYFQPNTHSIINKSVSSPPRVWVKQQLEKRNRCIQTVRMHGKTIPLATPIMNGNWKIMKIKNIWRAMISNVLKGQGSFLKIGLMKVKAIGNIRD